ncbi:hypothetical protein [Poseidonibacter ostreae]|jgi:hypothetical protein|uniref:Uncharacterized protein n=1 Tax=Poseidonibacter ostreae TaxID=2654171 RepID=A0A6L4WQ38_9BACT|nr:hypothetical protein [Poseidonibacter ostreae]KAB7886218.1 hypothetical protein GBG19_12515 [Poseidonibacter ostreae]KAB7886943.1 hypothetical protein GA417_04030 [Poseidonibacter ostreae]KAB7892236.1 hypothetical protein GBG18_03850 [Poseidonibacter ostreae]MAC83768.1 hypothetical protein [Arcobacter sp.]|tara:strand:+ start:1462 stop:1716 length:255 start_codon:yes stop_codon:yes gene_type:complete
MKLLTFIIGISIPLFALFIALQLSPTIGNILIKPISYISNFLEQNFNELSYTTHALLIFSMAIFSILLFIFSSKFFMKKILNKI